MWLWATHSGSLSIHNVCAARIAVIRLYIHSIFQQTATVNELQELCRVPCTEGRRQTLPCTHGARLPGC